MNPKMETIEDAAKYVVILTVLGGEASSKYKGIDMNDCEFDDKIECVIAWACIVLLLTIGFILGLACGCMHKNREIEQIQTEHVKFMQTSNAKWSNFINEGGVLVIASVRGTVWKREAKAKGRVKIGTHNFVYFPKSGVLAREDFCGWVNSHWHECLTVDGKEKLPETADKVDMTVKGELPMWKDIRKMALQCREITGMMHESSWNSLSEMKEAIADHMDELRRDEAHNQRYLITNIQTCLLNIVYDYRRGNYANVVSYFKQLGALGLSGAMWVQEQHGKSE